MCEYICLLLELPSCVLNFGSVILLVWCCSSLTSSFCLTHLLCVLWLLRHHHSFKPRVRVGLLLILCRLWWHLAVVVPAVAENMKKKGRHQRLKKKKKENQATGCVQRFFLTNLYWRKIWIKNFCLFRWIFSYLVWIAQQEQRRKK